jgi:hypothetical protein
MAGAVLGVLDPTTEADEQAQAAGGRIASGTLNVTVFGGLAAGIAAVAAAVAPIFPISAGEPVVLQAACAVGRASIIVAALIATAIMISADIAAIEVAGH